jgi:hypothetical protein
LEWRGEKIVEEGNINAVEGNLVSRRLGLLARARELDAAGETVRAVSAYRELLSAFPDDTEIRTEAKSRLAALFPAFKVADMEMFRRIGAEAELKKREVLCQVYLDEFTAGAYRSPVQATLTEIEKALPKEPLPGASAQEVIDDREQVEAIIGNGYDLRNGHMLWLKSGTEYPKFSDYMLNYYDQRIQSAKILPVAFGIVGVALLVVGPVMLAKADEKADENDAEILTIVGATLTGEGGLMILLTAIIAPVVGVRAKKKKQKLESMMTTALRYPRPGFVGFSPLVGNANAPYGLALNWEY